MSTEFEDLLSEGFEEVCGQVSTTITGANGESRSCISGPIMKSKKLRESGLMPEIESTVELTRVKAIEVGILDADGEPVDRYRVQVGRGKFLALLVEDDPADPTVRVHLKRYRGA